jgi:large repetitive protein
VQAVDDGGTDFGGNDTSAPQSFVIAVTPVNDAPSFTAGGDQVELLNIGGATHAGWATNISAGPANESGQAVSFVAVASNPGLFSVQPQVQPDGTLTYTTAFLALGSSQVTVTAVDNGGTANGGANSSPPQSFTITIIVG